MRSTRLTAVALACLVLLTACAAKHQLPQTALQVRDTVASTEAAYLMLYREHKANRLSQAAMGRVDEIYEAWRVTNAMLLDAVRAGAVTMAPPK